MTDYWTYRARPVRVIDGDTFEVEVDLGFHVQKTIRIRLIGVDTDEIYGVDKDSEEFQLGQIQKQFVEDYLFDYPDGVEWPLTVVTQEETGKYGRWLADVQRADEREDMRLSEQLIAEWPHVEYN